MGGLPNKLLLLLINMKKRRAGAVMYQVQVSHKPNIGHSLICCDGGTAQPNH